MDNGAANPSGVGASGDYPDYTQDVELFTNFFKEHTVLITTPTKDDDDDLLLEPGTINLTRMPAYTQYLKAIKAKQYHDAPVLQLPLDQLVSWNTIQGEDLAKRVQKNTRRYVELVSKVLDDIIDSLPSNFSTAPTNNNTGVRDSIDILQEQRIAQHEAQAAAAAQNAADINGPLGGGGLANDPTNTAQNNDDAAVVNAIPPLLLRRYELRILPLNRNPQKNQLGLNFLTVYTLAPPSKQASSDTFSPPINEGAALRHIRSRSIGRLVSIKGMIVRASDVKPSCTVATYTCDRCGAEVYQEVRGREFMPHKTCPIPTCGTTGNSQGNSTLFLQTRGSKFVKFQEWKLQELPSQVPIGHVPRSMPVHGRGELTRLCVPGDVVTMDGIFLPMRNAESGGGGYMAMKSAGALLTTTYLEAMNVTVYKKSYEETEDGTTESQQEEFNKQVLDVAHGEDPVGKLSRSIAPEIFGHEDVKRALLLQLVSGCERKLPDGMRIRGDINVCLMGDPGVAKSQLLKYISSVAPRGVYTTGRGSSCVGLTAAITKDVTTGDLALEGGALVLADRGICCIDEFDKMDEMDRTAIHEVMEQQTVSIAKAGIVATLNARAAVLAAANPLWGRYNRKKSLSENINLPNSLLSRFDLMFLLLDVADADRDMALARHVTFVHRYNGVINKELDEPNDDQEEKDQHEDNNDDPMDEDDDATTRNAPSSTTAGDGKPLDPKIVREYIRTARQFTPMVPPEVAPYIVEAYVGLRMQDSQSNNAPATMNINMGNNYNNNNNPSASNSNSDQTVMTARQLLSILRLSQALARLRFSDYVAREDVDEAIRLTHMSKASLLDQQDHDPNNTTNAGGNPNSRFGEDIMSRIFNTIRDYATASRQRRVELRMCEAMVLRKGFTTEQLKTCLEEYEALNVISVNSTGTHIDFMQDEVGS